MNRFDDIRYQPHEALRLAREEEARSPHVVDLKNISKQRPSHDYKIDDIKAELDRGLKRGLKRIPRTRYEKQSAGRPRTASRFTETLRMGVIGVLVVVGLNTVGTYYRGLELKDAVATAAVSGYESIAKDGPSRTTFQAVQARFEAAQDSLWFLQNQRGALAERSQTSAALATLLDAGEDLTWAGEHFMNFLEDARTVSRDLFTQKVTGRSATGNLSEAYERSFKPALAALTQANRAVQEIRPVVFPADLRPTVTTAQKELLGLANTLTEFDAQFSLLLRLLGDVTPQRYLILLENNHESRPGGGFIGSYMILDLNDGYVDGLSFHDVYDLDNRYHKSIEPPVEVARLTNEWRFRDSNTSPDMAVSADQAAWFLEEEGGPGVDHVLTVDLSFVEGLLELIGPVKINALPIALASDNFALVLSYMVEAKLSGETVPKEVLREFIEQVQIKLKEKQPWPELLGLMQRMAAGKHVALNSENADLRTWLGNLGLTGTTPVPVDGEDYFLATHTAIGNKTDAYMTQDIVHRTVIDPDGTLTDTAIITRTHTWNDFERLRLKNLLAGFGFTEAEPWLIDLLGGAPNTSVMRVYVPHGARLLFAEGIDQRELQTVYDSDLGLDYFTFPLTVHPGTSETVTLSYQLPSALEFKPLDEYRLTVLKQPGDVNTTFTKIIEGGPGLNHYRSFPEALLENAHERGLGVYTWNTPLDRDLHVAQLWGE